MSSHHIIRENQEPALIIADAHAISYIKIQELLEWMPTVVVLSSEVDQVVSWGIKVDVVIAPISELSHWRDTLVDQAPIKIISYNDSDDPLSTAFYFLIASKATAVNCLVSNPGELAKLEPFRVLDIEAFTENKLWSYLKNGHFEKWVPAGTVLYPLPDDLKSEFIEFSSGSYQTNKEGIVSFKSNRSFWIGEELI